jgi:pyrroline-5-carboxylate reductase
MGKSDTVVFAVKPQNMAEVVHEVKEAVRDDHLLITIAAGTPLKMIRDIIGRQVPMIRVMPNTPALVLRGASALAAGPGTGLAQMTLATNIFNAVGETVVVEEAMMDAVTAVSGSGPGYVFRLMECMVEGGAAVGLDRDVCKRLVIQTFLGAAHLAKGSEDSLKRLREKVTSPGGTTAAGLAVFEEMGLEEMIGKVIDAACRRGEELGKGVARSSNS